LEFSLTLQRFQDLLLGTRKEALWNLIDVHIAAYQLDIDA